MKVRKAPVLSETVKKLRTVIEGTTDGKLPSVRNLARHCSVSPVTILRAIEVLKKEGVLQGRWGSGHYIAGVKKSFQDGVADLEEHSTVENTVITIKKDIVEGKYLTHLPLPSIKQLTAYYNVSYPTIKKAIAVLTGENVIKRSGSRYFFFTGQTKSKSRIAIIAFGLGKNAVKIETERERNFYRLLSNAAMQQNVILETICCNDYLDEPQFYTPDDTLLAQYLKSKNIIGIILSSYHMKDSAECLRKLLIFDIPISAWVEDHKILKMVDYHGSVKKKLSFFDSSYSILPGYEVGRYLIGKGHKRIAYISPFHKSPWSQNRLAGLKKAAMAYPDIRIIPYVSADYLNDYFFLEKIIGESSFGKELISEVAEKLHPFLRSRISSIQYEHDILLRDNLIFTVCEEFIKDAFKDSSITAWVCANDQIAVLITDYWNYCSVPLSQRPALIGFDNSFKSFERNISSYEFNTSGEVQNMLNHLLYPNSTRLLNGSPEVRLSGRIVERNSSTT
jgi:DNA-binding transcriptional regulator YhcF (GntR family)